MIRIAKQSLSVRVSFRSITLSSVFHKMLTELRHERSSWLPFAREVMSRTDPERRQSMPHNHRGEQNTLRLEFEACILLCAIFISTSENELRKLPPSPSKIA